MSQAPPARVFLRPIGSPLTLGLSGLAAASFVQSGLELRWIAVSQTHEVGIMVLTLPFVLPLAGCVLAYLARDAATGTAAGVIATTWLALGVVQVIDPPHATSGALGLMLIAAASLLALTTVSIAIVKPLPALLFFAGAVRFALTGVYHLSSDQALQKASGVIGLILFAAALYAVLAFELEDQRKPLLPTFRRKSAAAAVAGPDGEATGDLAREPGVRRTI
ncbi:MAG: hypothetical protein ACTHM1_10565 [Solirubrobacteraceae bacterium]